MANHYCYSIPENQEIKNSNKTIRIVLPFLHNFLPYVYYFGKQVCGVLIKLVYELSIKNGFRIVRNIITTSVQAEAYNITNNQLREGKVDLKLFPLSQTLSHILRTRTVSRAIGVLTGDHIVSVSKQHNWPLFTYFGSFEIIVWLSIILSILLISLFIIAYSKINPILAHRITIWRYIAILLSEPFPTQAFRKLAQFLPQRIVLTVWLFSCTVLLSAFSSVLLGFFIKSLPYDSIDTYEQLFLKNDIKIITVHTNYFNIFVMNNKKVDKYANNFNKRVKLIYYGYPHINPNNNVTKDLLNKLKSRKFVFIINKMVYNSELFYANAKFKKMMNQLLHFSVDSFGQDYYVLELSHRNKEILIFFNKLIKCVWDSGLYDHWFRKSMNSDIKDIKEKYNWIDNYAFVVINFDRIKGVFLFWFIGFVLSVLSFIYEIIHNF